MCRKKKTIDQVCKLYFNVAVSTPVPLWFLLPQLKNQMPITADQLSRLERQHDAAWICLSLLGQVVLMLRRPESVCYSIIVYYRNQEWFDSAGVALSRVQVEEIVNGCIGARV